MAEKFVSPAGAGEGLIDKKPGKTPGKRKNTSASIISDSEVEVSCAAISASESEIDEGKRVKLTSSHSTSMESVMSHISHAGPSVPAAASAAAPAAASAASVSPPKKNNARKSRVGRKDESSVTIADLKKLTSSLMSDLYDSDIETSVVRGVLDYANRYEELLMKLMLENERLKGRLDAGGVASVDAAGVGPVAAPRTRLPLSAPLVLQAPLCTSNAASVAGAPVLAKPIPKPEETWSVVVRGKKGATSKEVVGQVLKEVAPSLGVRLHGVKPMKDGGAVIRTPSQAERSKIANNSKFAELGLEVSVKDKLGPKIQIMKVDTYIEPSKFMTDLYTNNIGDRMEYSVYQKSVRMMSKAWQVNPMGNTNVALECTPRVAEMLLETGGVYVEWHRYRVRALDEVATCHRCFSFDHRIKDCRMAGDICRRCGLAGHLVSACPNPARCRNCEVRGYSADHMMISPACPVYASHVARANARH